MKNLTLILALFITLFSCVYSKVIVNYWALPAGKKFSFTYTDGKDYTINGEDCLYRPRGKLPSIICSKPLTNRKKLVIEIALSQVQNYCEGEITNAILYKNYNGQYREYHKLCNFNKPNSTTWKAFNLYFNNNECLITGYFHTKDMITWSIH